MLRLLAFIITIALSLYAEEQVEIYATTMQTKEDTVEATGEVMVVYADYYLSASRVVYNRESGILELFGNIRATKGKNYKLLGDYARLNISKKERLFRPFYMLEKTMKVWMSGDEALSKTEAFDIDSGMLSGCDPTDPLWKMHFSSTHYDTKTKWLSIYNARIFIYDIPVFYTPYFGYSLDTKRRTGLLSPSLGVSSQEGMFFEQPLYIAEQNWWDLTIKPQMRTYRGSGVYAKYRFIDSKLSSGSLTAGYFKEKLSYATEHELASTDHYGYNFLYSHSSILNSLFNLNLSGQSSLYIDLNNMNDVDYINLSTNDTTQNVTSKQVLSRGNLFYNTDENYFATYFKYYKDLTQKTNEKTLQKLPTFQYHHYLKTMFGDTLFYNLDMQSHNIYRQIGKRVVQTDLNIPITIQKNFFDEYINLSYKSFLYAQHSKFSDGEMDEDIVVDTKYEDGHFLRNHHAISVSTQLSRAFENFTHVFGLGAKYTIEGSQKRAGYYENHQDFCADTQNKNHPDYKDRCEFYNISSINEHLQIEFLQYFYDAKGGDILSHRLTQNITYKEKREELSELENEFKVKLAQGVELSNNMFYNYDEKSFSKIYNTLTFATSSLNLSLSHLYKDSFLEKTDTYSPFTSYITSSASYTYNKHYSYGVKYNYDVELDVKKSSEVGFLYQKRCWDFGLRYLENNRPIMTSEGLNSVYERYLYFTINLKPLISSNKGSFFDYKLPETLEGM